MNVLSKLSIKNLKLNKKRTISTIIGIVLSVALICAVATLSTSVQATLVENAIITTLKPMAIVFTDHSVKSIDVLKR